MSSRERILLPEPLPRSAFVPIERIIRSQDEAEQLFALFGSEKFIIRQGPIHPPIAWLSKDRGGIVLRDDATSDDVFRAIVAWNLLKYNRVKNDTDLSTQMQAIVDHLRASAKASGWRHFVYPKFKRRARW